jgi:hypothetical protein
MLMKASIEVESRKEAELIKVALEDPATRALIQIVGALAPLSERAQKRVLDHVADMLAEETEAK